MRIILLLTAVFIVAATSYGILDFANDPYSQKLQAQAEKGDANSEFILGLKYLNSAQETLSKPESRPKAIPGLRDYDLASENLKIAAGWFHTAAEQGLPDAQFYLGYSYDEGVGVTKNLSEAVRWYQLAAAQGNLSAINNLGVMYRDGTIVRQDYDKAVKLFQQAAASGIDAAEYNLADAYFKVIGVKQDYKKALSWYLKSAEQGYTAAEIMLSQMYQEGQGTSNHLKSYIQAYKWVNIACTIKPSQDLYTRRNSLVSMMSQEQIIDAQRQSKVWLEIHIKGNGNNVTATKEE